MLGQKLLLLGALQEGVGFYLVDRGHDLVVEHQVQVAVGRKVRDADRAGAAFGVDFFHGAPRAVDVTVGLVDEVEVDVVQA